MPFDGTNTWVASRGSTTVTKLRASDGSVLGNFTVPSGGYGAAFDGTNIWLSGDTIITELSTSGKVINYVSRFPTSGIAFDGANIWVSGTDFNLVYKF